MVLAGDCDDGEGPEGIDEKKDPDSVTLGSLRHKRTNLSGQETVALGVHFFLKLDGFAHECRQVSTLTRLSACYLPSRVFRVSIC